METTKKILIVDDEPDLAQMVGYQFSSKGFEVQNADDGLQALEKINSFRPDLIILDMNMPRMGGIEFYSKICGTNGRPMFPVLVLTARANVQGLFKDLEIDGFMTKPFEIDQLVSQAELIIKNRSKSSKAGTGLLERPPRVCIVENDPKIFSELTDIFLNADYTVMPAKTGAGGIERMLKDVPDVALIQLGLKDISGDVVIFRLSQMAKTMDVKYILYTAHGFKHDRKVMEGIGIKTGIITFVEYKELGDLLEKVNQLF
jgi:DNA-binding response OmpR family regulator